jgi:hypothetical protein
VWAGVLDGAKFFSQIEDGYDVRSNAHAATLPDGNVLRGSYPNPFHAVVVSNGSI